MENASPTLRSPGGLWYLLLGVLGWFLELLYESMTVNVGSSKWVGAILWISGALEQEI